MYFYRVYARPSVNIRYIKQLEKRFSILYTFAIIFVDEILTTIYLFIRIAVETRLLLRAQPFEHTAHRN
jgi:hypothetical protein